jgi:chaperonin GroEL
MALDKATLTGLDRDNRTEMSVPNTIIIDDAGEGKSIEALVKAIRAQIEEANRRKSSHYDREKLQSMWLNWLAASPLTA